MNPLTLPNYLATSTDIVHETTRQPLTSLLTNNTPAHPFLTSEGGSTVAQAFASQERLVLLPTPPSSRLATNRYWAQRSGGRINVLFFFFWGREKERTEAAFSFRCTPPTQFNIKDFHFYSFLGYIFCTVQLNLTFGPFIPGHYQTLRSEFYIFILISKLKNKRF